MDKLKLLCLILVMLLAGCAHVVPLKPDSKWHTIYSLQVPFKSVVLEIESVNASRPHCNKNRIPAKTEIRILHSESFQNFETLPDKIEDAIPREDRIPLKEADSGPHDMTLMGSRRLIPLISGKQIIARSWDSCAALKITDRSNESKK